MPLVVIGLLLLIAKWAEFGIFGHLPWWFVLAPFGLAILWWEFADSSGWTKRKAMEKMAKRKEERREQALESLGLSRRRERAATKHQRDLARSASADPTMQEDTRPPDEPPRRDPTL
ncbi:MAG: TIGR04438 family Trp-rich protein [Burkholderiales bacterium]|nr:TIGR04438 family Trp-rich protein [Burkholderiales bacterium]